MTFCENALSRDLSIADHVRDVLEPGETKNYH